MRSRDASREWALSLLGLSLAAVASCSSDRGASGDPPPRAAPTSTPAPASELESRNVPASELRRQAYYAGPADASRSVMQREPAVTVSRAESSLPLSSLRAADDDDRAATFGEEEEHAPRPLPRHPERPKVDADAVLQKEQPTATMPATIQNFRGQGHSTTPTTLTGTPPDTNGAVGPNHFVQVVNGGIAIWDKSGNVVTAARLLNVLWSGYTGTNSGNGCATRNDGDPVVVYDQLANRWFVSQFSLPNESSSPNFQCVAVSKTADPSGAYWLYDFSYPGFNDYGKFGMWPDAYTATFNLFDSGGGVASDVCAYDRVSMLAGKPAQQVCFTPSGGGSGILPVDLDGPIAPPIGEPAFALGLGNADPNSLDLYKLHVDWTNTASSTLTGPTSIPVAAFTPLCDQSGTCVPVKSPGNQVDSLADRVMFRLSYRNFGTHESLVVNHSVTAGSAGGVRWYEIRSPNGTPAIYQQGTYAPSDGLFRWMGSLAMDQAEDCALGFSLSSASQDAAIGWTGRVASDALGVMGQGESVFESGTGAETGKFSNNQTATRWGDYSNMTVDPVDDCTFWYTQEDYLTSGTRVWDTRIASAKFPGCAANDFTISLAPATGTVPIGGHGTFTVTTAAAKGTAEAVVLNVQDLASGVTATFNPATVTAGGTATLTLKAAAGAPASTSTFTVIGKAPSAVHAAKAGEQVTTCQPKACPAGADCGSIDDGCGNMAVCGGACTMPKTCGGGGTANVCGCMQTVMCGPTDSCGTVMDPCMGPVSCGTCGPGQTCMGTTCVGGASDAGSSGHGNDGGGGARDGGNVIDGGASGGNGNGDAGGGSNGGCGCRAAVTSNGPTTPATLLAGVGLVLAALSRRRRASSRR